jgi:hypothetical protein
MNSEIAVYGLGLNQQFAELYALEIELAMKDQLAEMMFQRIERDVIARFAKDGLPPPRDG